MRMTTAVASNTVTVIEGHTIRIGR
jgi:hypothetical protein